jgi:hypothetical protein
VADDQDRGVNWAYGISGFVAGWAAAVFLVVIVLYFIGHRTERNDRQALPALTSLTVSVDTHGPPGVGDPIIFEHPSKGPVTGTLREILERPPHAWAGAEWVGVVLFPDGTTYSVDGKNLSKVTDSGQQLGRQNIVGPITLAELAYMARYAAYQPGENSFSLLSGQPGYDGSGPDRFDIRLTCNVPHALQPSKDITR